ncbi:MAG: metallophosphoesterase, partial [Bacteroidia bacterium]|nr:metallophosphoesterase [Bacteroidia bacterium]
MKPEHKNNCQCGCREKLVPDGVSRKDFLKKIGAATIGMGLSPLAAFSLTDDKGKAEDFSGSTVIQKGKAQHITLLHTSDIHGQVNVHDEFFWENGQAVYKKRGGFAHLKTMLDQLRKKNPNTLLVDGGDCFQGSAIATLSEGQALIPLMNNLNYSLMLPGNWEVAYGKKMLVKDMGSYNAPKVCANMMHDDNNELMFPPYQTFYLGGMKIGFVGYNDPLTPVRQSPAYSNGIKFQDPEKNIAHYIKILREQEQCGLVIALTHMGMAQQLHLANQSYSEGLDYIFGADTHERIRSPLQGKYARVTEPGAFSS